MKKCPTKFCFRFVLEFFLLLLCDDVYGFVVVVAVVVVVVVLVVLARYLLEFIANPVALLVLDLLILLEYFLRVFWYRIAVCSGITSSFF